VNLAAVVAWLIGLVVSLLFTVSPLFAGPLAIGLFARSSLGYFLGFAVSAVLYTIALRFLPAIGTSLKQSLFFPSQTERIPSADS
jgi:cytosine/uracil/thiamine/allantoin permease